MVNALTIQDFFKQFPTGEASVKISHSAAHNSWC